MILKASQRAGGLQLAHHLMNIRDNDHVEMHELRGFIGETLDAAFVEAYAVSRGTKCRQFLFSLSLSPPETETVPVDAFEKAIEKIETKIGLTGQPRAIVFHEKEGRRHAHCVWSRIDTDTMTAINLPHFKRKLCDISRELYLEHNWQMPRGLMNAAERDPLNFTLAEWQQAKRIKQDPRVIKKIFQSCWNRSDSVSGFKAALEERGFFLAKGDKRGHVAVDADGEVFSLSRWLDLKAKDVRAKLGDELLLPSVKDAMTWIEQKTNEVPSEEFADAARQVRKKLRDLEAQRFQLVKKQRAERTLLSEKQAERRNEENRARAARLPTGLKALWFRVTGKYQKIAKQNADEKFACDDRDNTERQRLIEEHLRERQRLLAEMRMADLQERISLENTRRSDAPNRNVSEVQQSAIHNPAKTKIRRGRSPGR